MFIIWVKFVEIPKQIFGSQLNAINPFLISDKARCFSQSERALYGNFIIKLDTDTELARAVDVVMARAKRNYILIIKVNKLFSFISSCCFLKEIENMYSVFLSS